MRPTEEQNRQLTNWFQKHIIDENCPACGKNRWKRDFVYFLAEPVGKIELPLKTIPMYQLICKTCEYVMLFAANKIMSS